MYSVMVPPIFPTIVISHHLVLWKLHFNSERVFLWGTLLFLFSFSWDFSLWVRYFFLLDLKQTSAFLDSSD
jgi:hypothetical protein